LTADLQWFGTRLPCTSPDGWVTGGIDARTGACVTPANPSCEVSVRPGVVLDAEASCALRLHAARCGPGDACLVDCLARGAGEGTGGGCWHACFAYVPRDRPRAPSFDPARCR
jgi:hypothetical protein